MSYTREANNLTQAQALENLAAVSRAKDFRAYEVLSEGSRLESDLLTINPLGGCIATADDFRVFTLADLGGIFANLCRTVAQKGTLRNASLMLTLPEAQLKERGLDQRLFEDGPFHMQLFLYAGKIHEDKQYGFRVINQDFNAERLPRGVSIRTCRRIKNAWREEITAVLDKILPYKIS